ncbi:MAG: hypothetical protein HOG49_09650 [Candidatus Scalindua sp.]|jgi:hypothetical protein|nr:hypothetical protein [Candidatus Scalindua sp.]
MLNEKYFSALNSFDSDSYFKLLVIVAGADGNICESELAFLQDQAKLMDYDLQAVLNKGLNLSDIKVQGISIVTKKIVIRDCISLAHIDGVYDKNESEKIQEIGKTLGIVPEDIDKINEWLLEYWAIIEKGEELLTA